jgi:hypothetical protein
MMVLTRGVTQRVNGNTGIGMTEYARSGNEGVCAGGGSLHDCLLRHSPVNL